MTPALIDVGPSPWGWSYYENAFRCMHLFALTRAGLVEDRRDPLVRGHLGHVGTAHLHTRWMLEQQGRSPFDYLPPEDAMMAYSTGHPESREHVPRMLECFRRYVAANPNPPGRRILGVEHTLNGVIGTRNGVWGLWLDAPDVEPSRLTCPGHPRDGESIRFTRKLDLVIEDIEHRVFAVDFKFKASEINEKTAGRYAISGEFAGTRILASQAWPNFAGAVLWIVETVAPWRVARPPVPLTPGRDAGFALDIYRKAHEIAFAERDYPNPHDWQRAQNSVTCFGKNEPHGCPALRECSNSAAKPRAGES